MNMQLKTAGTGLLIATTLLAVIVSSCSGNKKPGKETAANAVSVTLANAGKGETDAVVASGRVESSQTANISTRLMGRITSINVKAGDRVSKGQLLATISDEDIRAKRAQSSAMIAEAEASLASAQKDYDRFNNLFKSQSATARELDNVTLQYNAAKARVEAAHQMRNEINAMLSYSSLTAPFSGVVTQKLAETGSIANPGMTILTIEQDADLLVAASVAESDISYIKTGDTAVLHFKSGDKTCTGKIVQLNPSSQFTGGQYIVKISIPDDAKKDLYSGMFVNVSIPVKPGVARGTENKVMIPVSAIVNRDELTGVYTVSEQNTALLRWIRLGRQQGGMVEVLSGLSASESYVLQADGKLYNGAPVQVKAR
ncbi:MAG: efflux RND transporter periplasmic adaptor subunit [Chitinophagaceae bacterium]|nr:efflux RND transporter periplasmic adaptor subunit [Chitinophagaceae bacterium]MBL0153908.1 efflux RND transporter periplasmic adaptor subunit [Chitinophagaceae bacterium]